MIYKGTKNELRHTISLYYNKFKIYQPEIGTLHIKVNGPISLRHMVQFNDCFVPVGVDVFFETMGFWESLFCFRSGWRN